MTERPGLPKNGLLAYYFESPSFQNLLFFSKGTYTDTKVEVDPNFISPNQKVQAVRWLGRIQPKQTAEYVFSTSDDSNVILQIQGKDIVINQGKYNSISLKENQLYTIRLEYMLPHPIRIEDILLSLQWWYASKENGEKIPQNQIYVPDFEKGTGISKLSAHLFHREEYYEKVSGEYYKVDCVKHPLCGHPACKYTEICQKNGHNTSNPPKPTPKPTPKPMENDPLENDPLENDPLEKDTDYDGIPDVLERDGFVISHAFDGTHYTVYPWLKEFDHDPAYYNNYPKYVSNPYIKNTVGDPYTDLEKAGRSIYIKGKLLPEAYHPLVAACPSVAVFMEGFTLNPIEEHDKTKHNRVSYQTSYGFGETNTAGVGLTTANAGKFEFGGKGAEKKQNKKHGGASMQGGIYISSNLKHHTMEKQGVTTTSSVVQKTHQSTEESTKINLANSAILKGIVRYRNMGTAMISNVKPTLNFRVANQTKITYEVSPLSKLSPGECFPPSDSTGLVVAPQDLFNKHPMTIDLSTQKKILEGTPLEIEAIQIKGTFTVGEGWEKHKAGDELDWSEFTDSNNTNGVMQRTARLTLETPNETLDRRVAAPSKYYESPHPGIDESWTPQLTLEQAIQIAFGARKDNHGRLLMTTQTGMTYKIDRSHVNVYVDEKTDHLISEQLKAFKEKGDNTKNIYDVTLTKEMVILIKPILEVNAFLNNDYLYIENKTDESLSYSVWRETGSSSKFLKQGIVPSDSTIGTGYLCENSTEELSIMVSREVSQVIFKGKVSDLEQKFKPSELKHTSDAPTTGKYQWEFGKTYKIKHDSGTVINCQISGGYNIETAPITGRPKWNTLRIQQQLTVDTERGTFNDHSNFLYNKLNNKPFTVYVNGEWVRWGECKPGGWNKGQRMYTDNLDCVSSTLLNTKNEYTISLSLPSEYSVGDSGAHQVTVAKETLVPIRQLSGMSEQTIDPSMIGVYLEGDNLCIKNKKSTSICYTIMNPGKERLKAGTISEGKTETIDAKSLKMADVSNRIIITVAQSPVCDKPDVKYYPVYDAKISTMSKKTQEIKFIKYYELDYWHLNVNNSNVNVLNVNNHNENNIKIEDLTLTNSNYTYDHVSFKLTDLHDIGLITSYEVTVNATSLGIQPMRVLELGKKQIINFFDYTGDTSKHPKRGQQVEIIAHDIFGNTHTVFSGKAELSNELWEKHYKLSEWHKKGNDFDALYLSPIPAGLTESVKSYDIQIGNERHKTVSFERQENGSYIRDQRLKLDFFKNKFPQEKLPKLHDHIELIIHTLENQTVTIDLGKVEESTNPASINALEKVHEIKSWTKDGDHYTHVEFDKESEYITSYVFKVNNSHYGEIPINQITKNLDLSKLNNKKIQKGDYVEMYAYKKDGEEVLIQSRYAGTRGLLGEYSIEADIKDKCKITTWSKTSDPYTSFTLGNLSDPVDSYIKKYEGYVNNKIVNLTQKGTTFEFDPKQAPHHGDIVQITVYTYTGKVIKLVEQRAGVIGPVTDENVSSIHQIKEWRNENKTIVFDKAKLEMNDSIRAHIKSYTIEVWKKPNTTGEHFGTPIQLNEKGELDLQDCKANQPLPQSPQVVRVIANLFDSSRKVVVMVRKVGVTDAPPTEQKMLEAHRGYQWNFEGEKLKSITFPKVSSEYASYISSYDVKKWSMLQSQKTPFQVDAKGVTVVFEQPIDISEPQAVGQTKSEKAKFSAVAKCIHIEEKTELKLKPILVIGEPQGQDGVIGVTPVRSVPIDDIKKAHEIEGWVYTTDEKHVTKFYFNKKIKSCLEYIQYYDIEINGKLHSSQNQNPNLSVEDEVDDNYKKTGREGLPMLFDSFKIYNNFPKPGDTLKVYAYLKNSVTEKGERKNKIQVIEDYKIPPPPPEYLSKDKIQKLKDAHKPQSDSHKVYSGKLAEISLQSEAEPYFKYIDYYLIQFGLGTPMYCPPSTPEKPKLQLEYGELVLRFGSYGVPEAEKPNANGRDCKNVLIYAQLKAKYAPENERCILVAEYYATWYDRRCM
ncbi:TPA: hypothetical protein QCU24_005283 [Bacillus cereus]|nr:hypothetical protein [Bacillus cereus]